MLNVQVYDEYILLSGTFTIVYRKQPLIMHVIGVSGLLNSIKFTCSLNTIVIHKPRRKTSLPKEMKPHLLDLHNGISYSGKMTSLYWNRALVVITKMPVMLLNYCQHSYSPFIFIHRTELLLCMKNNEKLSIIRKHWYNTTHIYISSLWWMIW